MSGPAVEAEGLAFAHAGRVVLRDLSLRLEPGARLAVLGRSGAGKTTLLRLLAGLIAPAAGTIRLGGRAASAPGRVLVPPQSRGVGLVFQGLALWPHLSVEATLAFAAGGPRAEGRATARRLAARVGLGARLDALPDQLSGGERQRLALARALARDPGLLLLDEPFAHQDAPLRGELVGLLLELVRERGAALIVVTHQADDALELAERALVLADGLPREAGPLAQLLAAPAQAETVALLGLGTLLAAAPAGERVRTALGELPLEPAGAATPARVWLRPEQVAARPGAPAEGEVAAVALACTPRAGGWRLSARLGGGEVVLARGAERVEPGTALALRVSGAARGVG